ncbi:CHAT domain-containing protein [Roseofilum casamattae]|uniref:CHAT domain-containing protein n=1 Tax=Roseofilum casamattae BLCC-M143 TaxID=3022442 RepID=A0ABT7BUX4_9CYAN|nr:CHAT domain-containing protein [Roseofilum casamattae]MDJ1182299.1 CHAT domain-containing protein [Roseofilum casamattae BLCC-M143]
MMRKLRRYWHYLSIAVATIGLTLSLQGAIAMTPTATSLSAQTPTALEQGRQLYQSGRFADAAAIWSEAAREYRDTGNESDRALTLSYLASAYQKLDRPGLAEEAIVESLALLESASDPQAILRAQALNTQANLFLYLGQMQKALDIWEEAENYYQDAGDFQGAIGSQLNQARVLYGLGYYGRAYTILQAIAQQTDRLDRSSLKIQTLHSLGDALHQNGFEEDARQVLEQGLVLAEQLNADSELSPILLSLGNIATDQNNTPDALYYFQQADRTAKNKKNRLDAQLNLLRMYAELGEQNETRRIAASLQQEMNALPPSRPKIYAAINFAHTLKTVEQLETIVSPPKVVKLLGDAVQDARSLNDPTAEAYALEELGTLYTNRGQGKAGKKLLEQSLSLGQAIQGNRIISQAAWTLGRVLQEEGKLSDAIAAYREAITALQALRGDLVAVDRELQFSFRESVEPVYRELVGLLLDNNPGQAELAEVRDLIENLQLAELDDFFEDACLEAEPQQIDEIDPDAALLYTIMLRDRLGILVSAAGQPIRYYSQPLPRQQVEEKVHAFLSTLHPVSDSTQQLQLSQQIYDWLIRPVEEDGALQGSKTLVFVLDDLLQRLPVGALHDGQEYLIEKYAVALSPGLQLLPTNQLQQQQIDAVVGGISESVSGFAALPEVEQEVQDISRTIAATQLLNQSFTRENLVQRLQREHPNVVHLATHGQFGSTQESTFLLLWDGQLNVRELSEMLRDRRRSDDTLELLVLSACDTAAGDDRAVLGLAGFAIKSGARSTIASLWPVRDRVAAQVMTQFYEELNEPGISKVEALRNAQLQLINDKSFDQPFFWASFVMVGNWL